MRRGYPALVGVGRGRWFGWRWKIREASRAFREEFFRKEFKSQQALSRGAIGSTFWMSPSACRDPLTLSSHIRRMEATTGMDDASRTGL